MGKQHNKVQKRVRRKEYLRRISERFKMHAVLERKAGAKKGTEKASTSEEENDVTTEAGSKVSSKTPAKKAASTKKAASEKAAPAKKAPAKKAASKKAASKKAQSSDSLDHSETAEEAATDTE